jgi:hypothetical protein
MGHTAVKTLADKLSGAAPPKRIDLAAIVVTALDLERPDIRELLKPDIKKYIG